MRVAENLEIEAEENGWVLHITDEDGLVTSFNIHDVAWDLPGLVDRTISAWRREGEDAVASARDRLTAEDLEAYPPGDPKRIALSDGDLDLARDLARGK
jgi:hypothetical protein